MSDLDVVRKVIALTKAGDRLDDAKANVTKAQLELGAALRAYREANGISLRFVAKKLKLSAPFISDCELGRRNLSEEHRNAYLKLLRPDFKLD